MDMENCTWRARIGHRKYKWEGRKGDDWKRGSTTVSPHTHIGRAAADAHFPHYECMTKERTLSLTSNTTTANLLHVFIYLHIHLPLPKIPINSSKLRILTTLQFSVSLLYSTFPLQPFKSHFINWLNFSTSETEMWTVQTTIMHRHLFCMYEIR